MAKSSYPRAAALKWSLAPAAIVALLLVFSTSAAILIGTLAVGVSAIMILFPQNYGGAWRRRYHALGTLAGFAVLMIAGERYGAHAPGPIMAMLPGDQSAAMKAFSDSAEAAHAASEARRADEKRAIEAAKEAKEKRAKDLRAVREAKIYACGGAGDGAAAYEAKEAVRTRLKNPAGAKFSSLWETTIIATADCKRTVIGWVDATNGFGATLRSKWGVDLEADGRGDWRVTAVLIE